MNVEDVTVEVRDKTMQRLGIIEPQVLDLEATVIFNNVGAWSLSLPSDHRLASALRAPGAGIVVTGPGDILFSGPTVAPTFEANAEDPLGTLTVEGVTDEIVLNDRIIYANVAAEPNVSVGDHYFLNGLAETMMIKAVREQAGDLALTQRQTPYFSTSTDGLRGPTIKKKGRFDPLGAFLAEIATVAGLGFRVVQRGTTRKFEIYTPNDRSLFIRLDPWNNTLAGQKMALTAPTATQVIVGGQGDLAARTMYLGTNTKATTAEAAWGRRIERFVDQRQTDQATEYQQKADEVLAKEGFTGVAVEAQPSEIGTMNFGTDYKLGDTISIVTDSGEYSAPVTSVVLKIREGGLSLGTGLGDMTAFNRRTRLAAEIGKISRRVGRLEAT